MKEYTPGSLKIFIWTYQIVQSEKGWLLNGVLLDKNPPVVHDEESAFTTFSKVFRTYMHKSLFKFGLKVKVNDRIYETATDEEGNFELEIGEEHIHAVGFYEKSTDRKIEVLSAYRSTFGQSSSPLLVISDIDDTILVSHSARFFSKLWRMLFRPAARRKAVEESEKAYQELKKAEIPFSYVSASEYNLFPLISTFIDFHKLPLGPIYLRPYRHWKQLLFEKDHGEYKLNRIRKLLKHFSTKTVVLFGDDSQQDLEVFQAIVKEFPNRVHSVFLRKTGFKANNDITEIESKIAGTEIDLYYYSDFDEIKTAINHLTDEYSRSAQPGFGGQ